MSLRTRLVAGLLLIATVGLLLAGGVTYAEQRSFLYDRIDRQGAAALNAVDHQMAGTGYDSAGPYTGPDGNRPHGGGGPGDLVNLPAGTYGEQRTSSGTSTIAGSVVRLSLNGQTAPSAPRLPATLRVSGPFTVSSQDGSLHYRVVVRRENGPTDAGRLTVAAIPLTEVDGTLHRLLLVEASVIGGVLLALAAAALVLVRLGLRPLERIAGTADAIAAGDLARRVTPATPKTEVGRLGLALNAMLGRLEHAFTRQQASEERLRCFLADASHELRTPLVSIRGYAELFRIGAASGPDDIAKAMTRIEQEAARMGVLVEDLLTLARLDELPDLQPTAVNAVALAQDAVADARASAPDRLVTLDAAAPDATVTGDPNQLHQVLTNLLRNALVHTPAGTPVEVRVARADGEVVLTVRDHGGGLPDAEDDAIFERFWRTEPGRGRGKAGAGLGLAIVAGIVAAHGGTVEAANHSGGGARFTVRLPAAAGVPAAVAARA